MPDEKPAFARPFPALTPAQRYSFDLHGYVVVPNVFTRDECETIREAMQRLKRDLIAANPDDPKKAVVRGANFEMFLPHHAFMANFYEYDDALLNYACHPRIVGMCEEVLGCDARITELNAHLNSKDPNANFSEPPKYGFHTGVDIAFGSHKRNGLYHCNFVKALTNLTDMGPDDGGTAVIVGSHKVDDYQGALAAAKEDASLIHQVVAPAGSVLLFPETLIHATGRIKSDRERAIIICGYGPRMYPVWDKYSDNARPELPYSEPFRERVPEPLRNLFFGVPHWNRKPRYRQLGDPADAKNCAPVAWPPL